MFDCGPVFQANYLSKADIVGNQGGTDSGKTHAILQVLYTIACTTKAPPVDPFITIVSESVPNAKKGAYRKAEEIFKLNKELQAHVKDWNHGERIVTFHTGWIMEFVGVTDEQNAKQGKRQYLFVNEANGIPYNIFWQYAKRTRIRVFVDYNPSEPFWMHDKFIGTTPDGNDLNAKVQMIYSDHRHNPFLTERDHEKTEKIKDRELWKVYARGRTGMLTGIIFPDWKMVPVSEFENVGGRGFGVIDFGYTNDPTAASWIKTKGKRAYVHELCYRPFMSAREIKTMFRDIGFSEDTPIYCDHDLEMIRQLRAINVLAIAAKKGPNSVKAGITFLNKEWEVFYTDESLNIHEERRRYMWAKDPMDKTRILNEPIDQYNHHMDAIRIGLYTKYKRHE